jgi:predicted transposase YdaD
MAPFDLGYLLPARWALIQGKQSLRVRLAELAALLWTFLLQASDLRREEVRRIVEETIPPEEKEQFMSTAEMLKEEGRVEGRQEGRVEGRQEGRAEGRQVLCESVLDLLETRFDAVPPSVRESLLRVEDLAQLRSLVRRAGLCSSVEEFAQGL